MKIRDFEGNLLIFIDTDILSVGTLEPIKDGCWEKTRISLITIGKSPKFSHTVVVDLDAEEVTRQVEAQKPVLDLNKETE